MHVVKEVDKEKLISLTGILGYPAYSSLPAPVFDHEGADKVEVSFISQPITLRRRINLKRKSINNLEFVLQARRKGTGLNVFVSQIRFAHRLGISEIIVYAAGEYSKVEMYSGYITWGKFGFQMQADYQAEFTKLMIAENRPEKYLHELLETEEGTKFWTLKGFSWSGVFVVKESSVSMGVLKNYLLKKGRELELK